MPTSFSVRSDTTEVLKQAYQVALNHMDLNALVAEFLSYLDYTEESESGREFHPITIGSCRVLMTQPLSMCIDKMRQIASVKKEVS
jgi:hypothetical protein